MSELKEFYKCVTQRKRKEGHRCFVSLVYGADSNNKLEKQSQ